MALEYVASPLLCAPTAAAGASVNGPGTAWVNTAYTTIIASTATAITLAGIVVKAGTTGVEYEIDIAKGGAGAEVVVATFRGASKSATDGGPYLMCPGALYNNIGSGQRVSFRLRVSSTTTSAFIVTVQYYATGSIGTATTTSKVLKAMPSAANGISLSTTTAWEYTAWTDLLAVTPSAIAIPTLVVSVPQSNFDWEIDLAMGIAGSEQIVTSVAGHEKSTNSPMGRYDLIPMLSGIPADVRLAVRMRKSSVFGSAFLVAAQYYELPL